VKILVACEYSGTVRDAFIRNGHEAVSCDLLPTESEGPHFSGDVLEKLGEGWDMMIAFPPCTYLCSSGLHWNKRVPGRQLETDKAISFVEKLLSAPIKKIAIENPIGCISSRIRKPDQIIQPWQFGHPESKQTCLWLKNLPNLEPTKILSSPAWVKCEDCEDFFCKIHNEHVADCKCKGIEWWEARGKNPYFEGGRWENQTPSGQNKLGPSADRWKIRSKTYLGIAEAMAHQWGAL